MAEDDDGDDDDEWEAVGQGAAAWAALPPQALDLSDVPMLPLETSPSLRPASVVPPALPVLPVLPAAPAPPPPPLPMQATRPAPAAHTPMAVAYEPPPVPPGTRLVRIKDEVVTFKRTPHKRASRSARPSEPSVSGKRVCTSLVHTREGELKRAGRTKLAADDGFKHKANGGSSGRGPAIRAQVEAEQQKMNHLTTLKARNIETYGADASFLLWSNTAEQCYDKLAESALRANAGGAAISNRKPTQAATNQSELCARHPDIQTPINR